MNQKSESEVLNELLAAECRCAVRRTLESTVFISYSARQLYAFLMKMGERNRRHCEQLTRRILDSGGAPWPKPADMSSADIHFLDLKHLLARIDGDLCRQIELYKNAGGQLLSSSPAHGLCTSILAVHEKELAEFRRFCSTLFPAGRPAA